MSTGVNEPVRDGGFLGMVGGGEVGVVFAGAGVGTGDFALATGRVLGLVDGLGGRGLAMGLGGSAGCCGVGTTSRIFSV